MKLGEMFIIYNVALKDREKGPKSMPGLHSDSGLVRGKTQVESTLAVETQTTYLASLKYKIAAYISSFSQ